MSIIEVYNTKFDDFHGEPVVTWRESKGPIQVRQNLLAQYLTWKQNKVPKNEPPAAFWDSNGPAIVRALMFCDAKALMFDYTSDRKVCYRWFGQNNRAIWWNICSVHAEGRDDVRVVVTLPTDEDVVFNFHVKQMEHWNKVKEVQP